MGLEWTAHRLVVFASHFGRALPKPLLGLFHLSLKEARTQFVERMFGLLLLELVYTFGACGFTFLDPTVGGCFVEKLHDDNKLDRDR